jgi:phenylacetate-CoA ligase
MQLSFEQLQNDLEKLSVLEWNKKGEESALALFKSAARLVPAYVDVLAKAGVNPEHIKTWPEVVKNVPIIDKDSYVNAYAPKDRMWPEDRSRGGVVYASSGTTGKPTFWLRNLSHDEDASILHEVLLKKFFHIDKYRTLFLDCFAMGIHVAGFITATSIHHVARNNRNVFLATPGSKKDDIIAILTYWAQNVDQVVLIGYPPLMRDIINEASAAGFGWSSIKKSFLFAAQGFSESWRNHILEIAAGDEDTSVLNMYGSADMGPMGFETPATISLRKSLESGETQYNFDLPNLSSTSPYIFNYIPTQRFFEEINHELVCTGDNGMPLIRYNIHDLGGIISPGTFKIENRGWDLPGLYLFGRSNHAVVFYGANIYPEHVQKSLEDSSVISSTSGRFFLEVKETGDHDPGLYISIELGPGVAPTEDLKNKLNEHVSKFLCQINREFLVVFREMKNEHRVFINLYENGHEMFVSKKMKQTYFRK